MDFSRALLEPRFHGIMLTYLLDLAGVAVFAASGVLAARDRGLDLFGILVVAGITAVGGGTLRDLLLDRHPIFWIEDPLYVVVIVAAAVATLVLQRLRPSPGNRLAVADAIGLGFFALSGAQLAEAARCTAPIVVVLGTMTGVTGGLLRDVLTAQVPLLLRREIYATAAIAGLVAYLLLQAAGLPRDAAFAAGIVVVVALRLLAIRRGLHLPVVGGS